MLKSLTIQTTLATRGFALRPLLCIASILGALPGCAGTDEFDDESGRLDHSEHEIARTVQALSVGPTNLTASAWDCTLSTSFTKPVVPSGYSIVRHELERRRTGAVGWGLANHVPASQTTIGDQFALTNTPYTYRAVTVFQSSNGSLVRSTPSNEVSVTIPCVWPKATSGTTATVNVHLMTPKDSTGPFTRASVESLMFDAGNPQSVYSFYKDVSAGTSATPLAKHVRLGGTVFDWKPLTKKASSYSGWGAMWSEINGNGTVATLQAQHPADVHVFIFNAQFGGGLGGGGIVRLGSSELQEAIPTNALIHEIGHALGLKHESFMYCPDGVPEPISNAGNACTKAQSSRTSVMSHSDSINYFSGYHKLKPKLLDSQTVAKFDYRTLTAGQKFQTIIYNSTTAQGVSSKQLITMQLDDHENMYVLQYRTAKGLDTTDAGGDSFPEGVYVYLRAGQRWDGDMDDAEIFLMKGSDETPLPVTTSSGAWTDKVRRLRFRVVAADIGRATVEVSRY